MATAVHARAGARHGPGALVVVIVLPAARRVHHAVQRVGVEDYAVALPPVALGELLGRARVRGGAVGLPRVARSGNGLLGKGPGDDQHRLIS